MRTIKFALLCSFFQLHFSSLIQAQEGIFWSTPLTVATSSQGDDSPKIGLLSDGTPVVIWGRFGNIYFSKLSDGTFGEPVEVSTNGIDADIYNFGGIDLATHADNIFIVFENFNDGVFLIRSTDGGETFDNPVNVYDPPPGLWATLPSVATDENGNPLVSVIREQTNETEGQFIMMRSLDGGLSFEAPVVASEPASGDFVCECCPSDIYSTGEDVFLIYRNNDDNLRDMWVSRSVDGAASFESATDVDDTDWVLAACPISGPSIAPLVGDSLITAWASGASGSNRVSFSTLNGETMEKGWEFEFPRMNDNADQARPDVAGQNDTIGIVWEESGFGLDGVDLLFAFSKNGSNGLTNNIANLTETIGAQRFPSLTYANGFFHLVHTDGGNGLSYRKGTVSEVSNNENARTSPLDFKLAPHPVSGKKLNLTFNQTVNGPLDFRLFSTSGELIKYWEKIELNGEWSISLEIGDLSEGIYFLETISEKTRTVKKVIVKN